MTQPAEPTASPNTPPNSPLGPRQDPNWYVYLLECADGTFYCGVTTDTERRLAQHNGLLSGGARYTSTRRPVRLLASMACENRSAALVMEWRIKHMPRDKKLAFFSVS